MQIEVAFPLRGDLLSADSHYLLFGSLSHLVPAFHDPAANIRFGPIGGANAGKGLIRLTYTSRLRVCLPAELIGTVLPLTGQALRLGEHTISLQVPTVRNLIPAPHLAARLVTFKNAKEYPRFLDVARRKLDQMDIAGEPGIPMIQVGDRTGEPQRKILRIKERRIIGFALQVAGLTAEESVRLQEQGLGGRCRIGCGFFVPFQPRRS